MYAATSAFASNTYKNVAVDTGVAASDPHGLISMLLSGAIERVGAARMALMASDTSLAAKKIGAAGAIVAELRNSLDNDQGGEIAQNLDNLYDYVQRRLIMSNSQRSQDGLLEVMDLLAQVYSAWLELDS